MKQSIVSDADLIKGAKAIADDMRVGDTRRLKLAKVVDDHLDWFGRARARGLEWTDIIELLFKVGVTRPDGRPLSRGHLSSLVWRKLHSADAAPPVPAPDRLADRLQGGWRQGAATVMASPEEAAGEPAKATPPTPPPGSTKRKRTRPVYADGNPPDRDKLIDFMRRSAQVRRND